jgi:hypothetical protein
MNPSEPEKKSYDHVWIGVVTVPIVSTILNLAVMVVTTPLLNHQSSVSGIVLAILYQLFHLAAWIIAAVLFIKKGRPRLGKGILIGLAITIVLPMLAGLALLGLCIASIRSH